MERKSWLLLAVFLAALFVVAACDRGPKQPDLSKLGPSSAATSTVLPVGNPQCPKGGIGIYTGLDANGNGILDADEIVKGSPICNDLFDIKKPNGIGSLIKIESEPTGTQHCLAGGLKILSGTDANKNSVLDPNEIADTEYICNGTPGSSSAAGITVILAPPVVPSPKGKEKKKNAKAAASKSKQAAAAAGKSSKKARVKSAPQPAAEEQNAPVEPAAPPKKIATKVKSSSAKIAKGASAPYTVPQGWTSVQVKSPQLARVVYKIDGRYIIVRFTNLSDASTVRFKYTVKWKEGQQESWADESTMEGITFRLKPLEALDREILTHAPEVKDVVIELDITESA